jgi:hypothetical protein
VESRPRHQKWKVRCRQSAVSDIQCGSIEQKTIPLTRLGPRSSRRDHHCRAALARMQGKGTIEPSAASLLSDGAEHIYKTRLRDLQNSRKWIAQLKDEKDRTCS